MEMQWHGTCKGLNRVLLHSTHGGFNRNGAHGLMCLKAWPIGSDTIRRCDLLEQVWTCWRKCVPVSMALRSQMFTQGGTQFLLLLSENQDVEMPARSLAPCLPACLHIFCHDNNDTLNCKSASIKCFSL